ncbi:MAG: hypothetical protein C0465_25850 [Ralstonia sp.]|uniref:5-bromo-4-chloroindolyl phosphate hydrolysis family protein n=1 Tax=Ralstonia sp. TaxID=54061 RepID=UPI00257EDC38|nr:5-bromo-4-chloroindolyl phosphate hydrolysis family protein [Ralstonia sp.]MBA4234000.1 hypothetical protein [Ralstonia sp.]
MASTNKRDVVAGLAAGGAAVVSYVTCVFLVDLSVVVSLIPAVLTGAGVIFLVPGTTFTQRTTMNEQEAAAIKAAHVKVKALQGYADQIPAQHAVAKRLVAEIGEEANRILVAIESDWNKFQAAESFLNQYLVPIDSWLSRYVLLTTRGIESAKDFLASAERKTLPDIKTQLTDLYEKLHINDVAQFLAGSMGGMSFPNIDLKSEETSS